MMEEQSKRIDGVGERAAVASDGVGAASEPVQTAPEGVAGRFLGVLAAPSQAFLDIGRRPTWLAPVLIALAAITLANVVYEWRVKPDRERLTHERIRRYEVEAGTKMSPEQVEQQVAFARGFGKLFFVLPFVLTPALCLLIAGIFYLAFGLLFSSPPAYKKLLAVVAWSGAVTKVVGALAVCSALLLIDRQKLEGFDPTQGSVLATNLGAFLSADTSAMLRRLASSLDVFTLWSLALMALGFAAVSHNEPRTLDGRKTFGVVFGLWGAWVLANVLLTGIFRG